MVQDRLQHLAVAQSEPAQGTSVRFAQTLLLEGLAGSVGSAGDALDNALAETTIGLFKAECARDGPPFRDGPASVPLAPQVGLEPTTLRLTVGCSDQLSYWGMVSETYFGGG